MKATEQKYKGRLLSLRETNNVPIINIRKTRRNDPCPCGSGKKFKHCCLDMKF
jgi:uncharacterized protein YecA (UPF0149 family)